MSNSIYNSTITYEVCLRILDANFREDTFHVWAHNECTHIDGNGKESFSKLEKLLLDAFSDEHFSVDSDGVPTDESQDKDWTLTVVTISERKLTRNRQYMQRFSA